MTEATQTVAETPAPAEPGATVESARAEGDDLNTLLAEFDTSTKAAPVEQPKPATTPPAPDPNLSAKVSKLEAHFNDLEMKKAIANVRGDLDPEIFDDALVEGFLHAQARTRPKVNDIYNNRSVDPQSWERTEKALHAELKKRFSKMPDKAATEDREAVAAFVRGSSNRLPEGKPANYSGMSHNEFRKSVREKYGYDPG